MVVSVHGWTGRTACTWVNGHVNVNEGVDGVTQMGWMWNGFTCTLLLIYVLWIQYANSFTERLASGNLRSINERIRL